MKFLHPDRDEQLELALDDVFIVPGYYDGSTRLETDLTPLDFRGSSQPVVSANMSAVTGKRMAQSMARYGGLGVLPQDMTAETVERIVRFIKEADPRYDTPLTVVPSATLRDVQGIIRKRVHDMVVVLDDDGRPIGIVTQADLRGKDQYSPVHGVMSTKPVMIPDGTPSREAFGLLEAARVKAAPVVDPDGLLCGVFTRDDVLRLDLVSPSVNRAGQLMVAAAVSISADAGSIAARYREFGVDVIVLDTAHGHQRRMIEAVQEVRAAVGPEAPVVAGNVCTPAGVRDLVQAGADVVKVNVGPGAMCTTRMQTGVGRPTFSAVLACARAARKAGKHVWADGGVRAPRDVTLYLAAGAARVMVGSWFAGTFESPGDVMEDREGLLYKENHGMASTRAVKERTAGLDPFDRARKSLFKEGISSSRIYITEGRESVGSVLTEIVTGVRSGFTYVGAADCREFFGRVVVGVQSSAGFMEGMPRSEVHPQG